MLLFMALIDSEEDKNKFEIMYTTYQKKMWYAANEILHNESDAEDAVQSAFLKVARNMSKIGSPYSTETKYYLITAVQNVAYDMQYRSSHKKYEQSFDVEEYDMVSDDSFEDKVLIKMLFDNVVTAIMQLEPIYSGVLYYYFVEERKPSEIAKLLDLKTGTVNKRLTRGKTTTELSTWPAKG